MNYELEKLILGLKVSWNISRNESLFKENFILKLEDYKSEVAPNIRYGEDPKLIEKNFKELLKAKEMNYIWCNSFQNAINNVLLKQKFNNDLSKALDLPAPGAVTTSFSIPIMDNKNVAAYLEENKQFKIFKLKVKDLSSLSLLDEVVKHTDKPIRIDANEGFKSLAEYHEFEKRIENYNIEFIEQPFATGMVEEYQKLKPLSKFEIIADESVLQDFNAEKFSKMFHGINVKNMKTRGVENSKRLLLKAKEAGLKTMVGCMIETSIGISEGMVLAPLCDYVDLDGALLLKDDPYKEIVHLEDGQLFLT